MLHQVLHDGRRDGRQAVRQNVRLQAFQEGAASQRVTAEGIVDLTKQHVSVDKHTQDSTTRWYQYNTLGQQMGLVVNTGPVKSVLNICR